MPGITFYDPETSDPDNQRYDPAKIAAAQTNEAGMTDEANPTATAFRLQAKFDNPRDLSRLDRLMIKVRCNSGESAEAHTKKLVSTQYLQIDGLKLRLTGKVVADFN